MKNRIAAFALGSMSYRERMRIIEARRRDTELDRLIDLAESRLAPLALAGDHSRPTAPPHLWTLIERAI
jgi:anti-sigma-K factor RskA